MKNQGSCQCGQVKYEITGEPIILYRCHCTECQTQAGSGFGMSMWVRNKDFEITEGTLKQFIRIADSGGKIECFFCGYCGVRIYTKPLGLNPDHIVLKPGTLDDASNLKPSADKWLKSKQAWFQPPKDTEHFDHQPNFKEFLNI